MQMSYNFVFLVLERDTTEISLSLSKFERMMDVFYIAQIQLEMEYKQTNLQW